ncbi:MAG: 4Fe-4S dicluster domain-containing protein [Acidobacteria bacterium]|nr:4Fe-4S dicluster domain-containing protein [Acidobacteriota bacterium]
MATRADPRLLSNLKKYGAADISACFNCGNCTAVCPLSQGNDAFPRRMIRYAQLGMKEYLLSSKELWLCHHCGECSETCPRRAGPAEFMAAARRYAISSFDPFGLARRLDRSVVSIAAVILILGVLFAAVLLWESQGIPEGMTAGFSTAAMLDFVPFEILHDAGIVLFVLLGVMALITFLNMFWAMTHSPVPGNVGKPPEGPGMFPAQAALKAVLRTISDVILHSSQRDCGQDQTSRRPLLIRRWFVHLCIMGGFLGLAAATILDYLFKDPDLHVMPWHPIRLLGILSGVICTYGVTVAILPRLKKTKPGSLMSARQHYYSRTAPFDWLFLGLLWIISVTGFVLTAAIYMPVAGSWLYVVFLIHVILAMELLILMPFTKFAHVIYRTVAIWFQNFRKFRVAAD